MSSEGVGLGGQGIAIVPGASVGVPQRVGSNSELDRLAAIAAHVTGAAVGVVALGADDGFVLPGAWGPGVPVAQVSSYDDAPLTARVVRSAQGCLVGDTQEDDVVRVDAWAQAAGLRSSAAVPIRDSLGQAIGALSVASASPAAFGRQDLARLDEVAALCSSHVAARAVLDRLSTAERSASAANRINRVLLNFSEALGRTRTAEDVDRVVRVLARNQLDAAFSAIVLEQDGRFDAMSAAGLPEDRPMEYTELSGGADHPGPQAVADGAMRHYATRADLVAEFGHLESRMSRHVDGEVYVPLRVARGHDGPLSGWLWLGWDQPHPTTPQTRRMKLAVASYVAQALERAALLAERAEVAYTLQSALLSRLPDVAHLELAARYLPASTGEQVGGDWYDAIHVGGVTTLIIGDVVGHNIAAAAQMGNMRSMLRGFVADGDGGPAEVLGRLDAADLRLETATMATALVAQVHPPSEPGGSGRLVWSSAGHLSPVLVGPDGTVRALEGRSDLMLGVIADAARTDHEAPLPPGTTVLLFTDGLVERRRQSIALSSERLYDVLRSLADAPLEQLLAGTVDAMGAAHEKDDVAVLAARLHG